MSAEESIPIATRWLLDASGEVGRQAVKSVCMIFSRETGQKGTGFLLKSGHVMTAFHVIEHSQLENTFALMSDGEVIGFKHVEYDRLRDLAILRPVRELNGGLEIHNEGEVKVGTQVYTWGYPLGYNGPAPLLTVGFLSEFNARPLKGGTVVKYLVVNSAFNQGNSGGPLFVSRTNKVIGVVVAKHSPIPPFIKSAIKALAENRSGVVFKAVRKDGSEVEFVESQIVAEILNYYRSTLTQVVIGEAVAGSEVLSFLRSRGL